MKLDYFESLRLDKACPSFLGSGHVEEGASEKLERQVAIMAGTARKGRDALDAVLKHYLRTSSAVAAHVPFAFEWLESNKRPGAISVESLSRTLIKRCS